MGRNKVPPKKTLTRKQNPGVRGRPAGSKNKSTILQEAIKGNFERSLKRNFQDVMGALIREAKDGNIAAIKLLMDKVIPNAQTEGERKTGDMIVQISISDMAPKVIEGHIECAEVIEEVE